MFPILDASVSKHGPSNGLVLMYDMKNFTAGHLFRNNLRSMKKFFAFVQEGSPIKIHQIHILNTVPFFHLVMAIIKPFMEAELAEKVWLKMPDSERLIKSSIHFRCTFTHHRLTSTSFMPSMCLALVYHPTLVVFVIPWKSCTWKCAKSLWNWESIFSPKRSKRHWNLIEAARQRDSRKKMKN